VAREPTCEVASEATCEGGATPWRGSFLFARPERSPPPAGSGAACLDDATQTMREYQPDGDRL